MPKKISLIVFLLVALLIAYHLVFQIKEAVRSGERLGEAAQKLHELETRNRELKNKLSEIKSERFIEQQARDKLGLAKEGETVVIIPEEKIQQVLGASEGNSKERLPNWLGWLKLFLR